MTIRLVICAALLSVSGCAQPLLFDSFEGATLDERWTVDSSAEATVTVDPERRVLLLDTQDNRYNHIETQLPEGAARVQVDLHNANDTAASWSPSVILYWDEANWVRVMLSLTYSLRAEWRGVEAEPLPKVEVLPGVWYRVALEMGADEVAISFGEADGDLREVGRVPRPEGWAGAPTLILGKGYMPEVGGNPDFDNNYSKSARMTHVEYDNVLVGDPADAADALLASAERRAAAGQHDPALLEVAIWPNITHPEAQETLWFADGAWQRLAVIYNNSDRTHVATNLRFEIEAPPGLAINSATFGPHALDLTRNLLEGATSITVAPRAFHAPADFRGVDADDETAIGWFAWPMSRNTPALHLHCSASREADGGSLRVRALADSGAGPWREMTVRVLDPLPELAAGPDQHLGLSFWGGTIAHAAPGGQAQVLDGALASAARLGVQRVHVTARAEMDAAKARGISPLLMSWWQYSTQCPPNFRPTEAERSSVPSNHGSGFCPEVIGEQTGTYGEFLATVTQKMRDTAAEGFMLDYECAMPLCYDDRCRDAFIEWSGLGDVNWPADVQRDGRYWRQWIDFRCWQGARYVKAIRDAAWEVLPGSPMQAWVAGYDYAGTIESATIDVSKAAEFLTEVETPHYTLPADYSDMWFEDAAIGSVQSGIETVQDTLEVVDIPVIFCSSIIYPLGSKTVWSDPQILDAQIQTIIAQGARGVSFWGGQFDGAVDGRYQHKLIKWHNLLAHAGEFLWEGAREDTLVQIAPEPSRELRAFAWTQGDRLLIAVTNLSQEPVPVQISAPGYADEAQELLTGEAQSLAEAVTVPALDGWWGVVERQ